MGKLIIPQTPPSYKTGYAHNADESQHPSLWKGLVGAWAPALGVTGKTLYDESGYSNDGTLINMDPATDWGVGEKGYDLDFDGTNDYVEALVPAGLTNSSECTASLWIKNNAGNSLDGFFMIQPTSVTTTPLLIVYFGTDANNSLHATTNNGGSGKSSIPLNDFTDTDWNHICVTKEAGTTVNPTIYINGQQNSQSASTSLTAWASNVIHWGHGFNASLYSQCNISSTFIYDRVLTLPEIQQLYLDYLAPFRRKNRTILISIAELPPTPSSRILFPAQRVISTL